MAPEARKPMGKAGVLPEEVDLKAAKMAEKKLQEQCEAYLRRHDIFYLRMPMHKPTSIREGWPDFEIHLSGRRVLLIEMKVEGGEISKSQSALHAEYLRQTGEKVFLIVNYDQFVRTVENELMRSVGGNICEPPKTGSTSQSR